MLFLFILKVSDDKHVCKLACFTDKTAGTLDLPKAISYSLSN
ncbi:hypothetical protein Sps_02049 [Shewanella psychrophila]|uniref:Uncharacterized protein n=1 Tax=Shewanella psychrophila TaxID=225848 RepID=A0A1S6HNY3_9GAMM|nr:hypothetical protein Sps_02049 [Shewanella psychrophila]